MANGYTPDPLYMEDPLMSLPEEELQEAMEEEQLAQIEKDIFAQELGAIDEKLGQQSFDIKPFAQQVEEQQISNFLADRAQQSWPQTSSPVYVPPDTPQPAEEQALTDLVTAGMQRRTERPRDFDIPTPTTQSAEAQAYRRQANYWKNLADKEEKVYAQKLDFGGSQAETYPEAQARIQSEHANRMKAYNNEFDTNWKEAQVGAKYPGISTKEAMRLEDFLTKKPAWNLGAKEHKDFLGRQATARRKLDRASRIDTMGAYGNLPAQILAALAVGMGAWSASRSGGRNEALDLYKFHIQNDIAAQREQFASKRARPGQLVNEYGFWMKKYGDTNVAELGVAASKWNAASGELRKIARETKYKPMQHRAEASAAAAQDAANRLKEALRVKAVMAERRMSSGFADFENNPVQWVGEQYGISKAKDSPGYKEITKELDDGRKFRSALEQYKRASKAARGTLLSDPARDVAEEALAELVAMFGDKANVGIMDKVEYARIKELFPETHHFMKGSWESLKEYAGQPDKLEFLVNEVQKGQNRAFSEKLQSFPHFRIAGGTSLGGTGRTGFTDESKTAEQTRMLKGR